MIKKEIIHPILGRIIYVKRIGNKYIRVTINSTKGIIVSMPFYTSYDSALKFVNSKIEEIQKIKERQKNNTANRQRNYSVGNILDILGFTIKFEKHNVSKVVAKIPVGEISGGQKQVIIIRYPDTWSDSPEYTSREWNEINAVYLSVIRKVAKRILPERTLHISLSLEKRVRTFDRRAELLPKKKKSLNSMLFSSEFDDRYFAYNEITIKNNKSNWGSCSSKNNINLNMHLVELPEELIDFVITHELCHLVYHNHSEKFHALLDALCNGREKELSQELKQKRII